MKLFWIEKLEKGSIYDTPASLNFQLNFCIFENFKTNKLKTKRFLQKKINKTLQTLKRQNSEIQFFNEYPLKYVPNLRKLTILSIIKNGRQTS